MWKGESRHSLARKVFYGNTRRCSQAFPIGHEHVNVYGKYSFQLSESIQQGAFHPLRELDETESLERDQEVGLPIEVTEISLGA